MDATTSFQNLDDDALALTARSNAEALDALLQRHAVTAVRIAHAVIGNREDALDAAQDALTKAACNLKTAWSGQGFRGWFCSIARGCAVDILRNNSSRRNREAAAVSARGSEQAMVAAKAENEENLAFLREELSALPEDVSNALLLFHLEGLPVPVVAEQLGVSVDACKQRLHRGREKLREQLERRGVRLATLALLLVLLEEWTRSSSAMASELPRETIVTLARNARSAANPAGPITETGVPTPAERPSTSAPSTFKPESSGPGRAPGRLAPVERNRTMTHKIAILAAAVLITLAIVISSQKPQSTNGGTSTTTVQAVRNDEKTDGKAAAVGAKSEKKELPVADAAPRWQNARFIKGDFRPAGIASAGKFAVVLVSPVSTDPLKRVLPQTPLQLLESQDSGATWSWGPKFPEYSSAAVAVDSDGTCVVLGLAGAATIPETVDPKQHVQFPEPKRAEYRIRPPGGTFSAPEIVWSEAEGSQRYFGEPCVYLVKGAVWAFALKPQQRTLMHHVAAYGENRSCPKPVGEWGAGGETAAWASDSQNAGFCVLEKDGLKHYFSADAGKSWKSIPIPFGQDPGSNRQYELVVPISMSRENQTISVLVNATFQANPDDVMSQTSQDFMISSSDLGHTWQTPTIADEAVSLMELLRGVPCIHAYEGNIAVCYSSKSGFKEVFNIDDKKPAKKVDIDAKDRVTVQSSADLGKTWFDQHALDTLSDHASDVHIGGDEHSLHVAIYKKDPQNEGYLVIRSYTSGQWATAKDVPAWYKETPVPSPTKEDF